MTVINRIDAKGAGRREDDDDDKDDDDDEATFLCVSSARRGNNFTKLHGHVRRHDLPVKAPLGDRGSHRSAMHLRAGRSRNSGSPLETQVLRMTAMCCSRKSKQACFFCAGVALEYLHGSLLPSPYTLFHFSLLKSFIAHVTVFPVFSQSRVIVASQRPLCSLQGNSQQHL